MEVKVVGIGGGRVKLGIEAPRQISVNRREIHDRICHNAETLGIGNITHPQKGIGKPQIYADFRRC